MDPSLGSSTAVLGTGSFGVVVRALWQSRTASGRAGPTISVAVKVITKSAIAGEGCMTFEKACESALEEAELVARADRDIFNKDAIVRVYGVARGVLPPELRMAFPVASDECVGIVMRYEAGGSLAKLLHPPSGTFMATISMVEKLRIAGEIARGARLESVRYAQPFFC